MLLPGYVPGWYGSRHLPCWDTLHFLDKSCDLRVAADEFQGGNEDFDLARVALLARHGEQERQTVRAPVGHERRYQIAVDVVAARGAQESAEEILIAALRLLTQDQVEDADQYQ